MIDVDVNLIHADPAWNCRGQFLLHSVQELAEQMREHTLLQPVVLQPAARVKRKLPEGKQYKLIAGFRRFTAATVILKWTTISAVIRDVDDKEAQAINLLENLERKDLNYLEEAKAIERLYPRSKFSIREIAKRLGRHTSWVQPRWKLLEAPESVQQAVASGRVSLGQLDWLMKAPDVQDALQKAIDNKPTRRFKPKKPADGRRKKSEVSDLITRLIDLGIQGLPTRVLAWTNGYVTNEELDSDIEQFLRSGRASPGDCVG